MCFGTYAHTDSILSGPNKSPAPDCVCAALLWSGGWKTQTRGPLGGQSLKPAARSNDDKAKDQFFKSVKCLQSFNGRLLCTLFLSVYRLSYSCAAGDAKTSFFFVLMQGNSNNIATVDISVGFIGLESYVEAPAIFLTALNTYAGPLLWACHLVCYLSSERDR